MDWGAGYIYIVFDKKNKVYKIQLDETLEPYAEIDVGNLH